MLGLPGVDVGVGVGVGVAGDITVILMIAALDCVPQASLTVKLNESEPTKPKIGVYVRFGAPPIRVPCAGGEITA